MLFDLKSKKYGFTLAEVLITLAVVGTVAAMTIPTLMMNYQKNIWESKLKKAYSITTNACERMLIEENVSAVNETAVYGEINNDTIKKYFKIMKDGEQVEGKGFSILTPDGAVLYLTAKDNGFNFYIDVNGTETRPNVVGKDEFEFRLDKNCGYDSALGEGASDAAKAFKAVVEADWKIAD